MRTCNCHIKEKITEDFIVKSAIEKLEAGIRIIKERGASYNANGVSYHDYQLNNLESTWESILECFVRLFNTKKKDPGIDWVVYSALQASFVELGMPQSQFSPIFNRFVPKIYKAIKERDIANA